MAERSLSDVYDILMEFSGKLGNIDARLKQMNNLHKELNNIKLSVGCNADDILKIKTTAKTVMKAAGVVGGIIVFVITVAKYALTLIV